MTRESGILVLETESLVLRYVEGAAFAEDTLSVHLKDEPASTWHYGEDFEDLGRHQCRIRDGGSTGGF